MDAAQKELADALAHRQQVDDLLPIARAELAADKEANKGKLGAPTVLRRNKTARLASAVSRLESGLLPGEHRELQAAPSGSLAASARANAQHHAQPTPLPSGRPPGVGQSARGGGGGGQGGSVDADDDADDDDDDEDASFAQYYRVAPNQKLFNQTCAREYLKHEVDRKVTCIIPPKILPSACQPELIGLGAFHMHAPHLELGLPLPPCPRCGWKSIDRGRVTSNGTCKARRVYAPETDEWVGGVSLSCGICFDAKQTAKARLEHLE
jgi:hypothetical protein